MTVYFGFAVADSMFPDEPSTITRRVLEIETVRSLVESGVTSCCNPSHIPTVLAMRTRFGLKVAVHAWPPRVQLLHGDQLIVMSVRGLPRLEHQHEYSAEQIAEAQFSFAIYQVAVDAIRSREAHADWTMLRNLNLKPSGIQRRVFDC